MRLMNSILFFVFLMAIGFPSSGQVEASPFAGPVTAVDTLEPTVWVRSARHYKKPLPVKRPEIKSPRQKVYEQRTDKWRDRAWRDFRRDQSEPLQEGLRLYHEALALLDYLWLDAWSPLEGIARAGDAEVAQAFSYLRRASDRGIGGASLILAYAHLKGLHVAHDTQAGLSYFDRALDILEQKAGRTLKSLRRRLKDLLEKALEEFLKCVIESFFDDRACQDDSARQHARAIRQAARAPVICGLFRTTSGDLCFNETAFKQCHDLAYNVRGDRVDSRGARTIPPIPFIYELSDQRPAKSTSNKLPSLLYFWSIKQRTCVPGVSR